MNDPEFLPDYLPNVAPRYGLKQLPQSFAQGEDGLIKVELSFNDGPLKLDEWSLTALVKKNVHAANILWQVDFGQHFYYEAEHKRYVVVLPAAASSLFLPGTYHLTVKGKQKTGTGVKVDRTVTLATVLFEITLDAASPNPKLSAETVTEVAFDPETGIYRITRSTVEPTVPKFVDISQS
ncbi:MAG: hypothetical protein EBU46_00385 [Nitrosomonadaceae bacterium]|nr:hypothetical protein [Nitrosomonadaceae bacterium]